MRSVRRGMNSVVWRIPLRGPSPLPGRFDNVPTEAPSRERSSVPKPSGFNPTARTRAHYGKMG
jgi:hypothetical protein